MSAIYPTQTTFNRGEISPLLATRADIDFWRQSLAYCRNFQVLTHGGLRRRSGTKYVATVKDSSEVARLFPFKFSENQAYVLVLNDGYIRFCALRGVLGAPYQIAHSWAAADLSRLSYAQVNDVAYFAHQAYEPKDLTRLADTNWSIAAHAFENGPFAEPHQTSTTLTPADYGALTPRMTSNTTPSGSVGSTDSLATAYNVFDKNEETSAEWSGTSGHVSYDLGAGNSAVVDHYWLTAPDKAQVVKMPIAWKVEGSNDGTTWVTLDTRSGQSGWGGGETRYFDFQNKTAYRYHRLRWSSNDDTGNVPNSRIVELAFNKAAASQTAFNLTASATTGINDGQGFLASDVGRQIRLMGSDGKWRWAEIVSRTSSTVVTIKLHGHALPDLSPIINWRMGAFSEHSGWPGSVALYNERLMWGRTDDEPVTVYGSKQGDFNDYGVSDPLVPTDGLKITLLSSNMNDLLWLADDEDLITGSAGQIRSIGPSDTTQSFSATNLTQKKGPTSGASYLQPISIGGVVLYVGEGGTKIRELVLGDQNRYVAPELTILAEHMLKSGIVDWAFAEKPDPTIYVVTGDGLVTAITYDREQKVLGFARHDVGGTVESVAVIPGIAAGYDDLYMVVRRTINGATVRYVEVLERPFDGDIDAVEDAYFVDCGLSYSGAAISTVTGLSHLEGEAVIALADGGVVRSLTVSGGTVTLPYAAEKIQIGLEYTSRAITLPVAGPGQDGTLFGRRKNVTGGYVDVLHTGALKVGPQGSGDWTPPLYEQVLHDGGSLFGNGVSLVTGFKRCEIDGSWVEGQGQVIMESSDPLPCLIRSFVFQVESEP